MLNSFGTAANSKTCRLAQPLVSISQWSTSATAPHLCIEIYWPCFELDCMLLGKIAATIDIYYHSFWTTFAPQSYASRLSATRVMRREHYSSETFALKPGERISRASRCLGHDSSGELSILRSMCRYTTVLQSMPWDPRHSYRFSTALKSHCSMYTWQLRKLLVEIF